MSMHQCISQLGNYLKPRRSPQRLKARRSCWFRLEPLEDRVVPTVVFDPVFQKETIVGSAPFTVLNSPTVDLVFWGSGWGPNAQPGPSAVTTLTTDAKALLGSKFFGAADEYGDVGKPVYGGEWTDSSSNPSSGFASGNYTSAIQGEIANAIATNPSWAPSGTSLSQSPIYVVIPFGSLGGYNTPGVYNAGTPPFSLDAINICVVSSGAAASSSLAPNAFTQTLSHELAEDITDPTGNNGNGVILAFPTASTFPGYYNETTNPPGINNNPSLPNNQPYLANSGVVQIGDGEQEVGGEFHYGYELNGVEVQSLWSESTLDDHGNNGAFIVADGNSQTVYLDPIWTTGTIPGTSPPITGPVFTGNYDLTLVGNAITVNANDSLTTVTVDNENFSFANFGNGVGQIQNITIDPEGANATVTIANLSTDQTSIIQGTGADTVEIGTGALAGSIQGIKGLVDINNTSASTTIYVDDSGDHTSQAFLIDSAALLGTGPSGLGVVQETGLSGTIQFSYGGTSSLTLETGTGPGNQVDVAATGVTTNVFTNNSSTLISIGDSPGVVSGSCQYILGLVYIAPLEGVIPNDYNDITVDDSADGTTPTVTLGTIIPHGGGRSGYINGLGQGDIYYDCADTQSLTLDTGAASKVDVLATGTTINLVGTGNNTDGNTRVDVGSAGSVQGVLRTLNIENPTGSTTITVDDSADKDS